MFEVSAILQLYRELHCNKEKPHPSCVHVYPKIRAFLYFSVAYNKENRLLVFGVFFLLRI